MKTPGTMQQSEEKGRLFDEFPPISTEEWEAQIHADLKGADYEKKLIWKTQDGFSVKPYYRAEDIHDLPFTKSFPGQAPFVRGANQTHNAWEIRQDIDSEDPTTANKLAVDAIERGAEGIGLKVKEIHSEEEMAQLLKFIELEKTAVHFTSAREYPYIAELLIKLADLRTARKEKIKGSLGFDPFNYFLLYGEYYNSLEDNLNESMYLIQKIRAKLPCFRVIHVSGDVFHNAGATASQELAMALASGHEYLYKLSEKGLSVDEISPAMQFTFALGSNYFLEIAKIRAARLLWSAIVGAYKPQSEQSRAMYIHGTTSGWNKTIYDPYVNLLRTSTESMAAAVAGCNSISVNPFDSSYKTPDPFSMRLARNTQIILKEESYLDKIVDPAGGSYYIENLTNTIAAAAWDLFKKIEEEGGFLKAVQNGTIRRMIEETATQRDMDIARRSTFVLGTNQLPNSLETMSEKILRNPAKEYPGLKLYRGTESFEALRLSTEKHVQNGSKRPVVFLFSFGNLTMRKARAGFASNFFGCAGYKIAEHDGTGTLEDGVHKAKEVEADIVVLCSSDEEYGSSGLDIIRQLKEQEAIKSIVVAGNPVEFTDVIRQAGVEEFIHVRTNVLDSLKKFHQTLGINITF